MFALICSMLLQMANTADISSVPNDLSEQQIRAAQGQEASQAAAWAPAHSANAAAPRGATLPSLQPPVTNRPATLSISKHAPTQHDRPSAPYLSRPTGYRPSRQRPYPVSTAAAATADKRQVTQKRRLDGQQSSRRRPGAETPSAAEAGDRRISLQSKAQQRESQAASVSMLHATATGVIDLTIGAQSASPSTSAGSDCMIMGASVCFHNPAASASVEGTLDWAQARPICNTMLPVSHPRETQSVSSAGTGAAEPWQSSAAALQLPGDDNRFADTSLSSAAASLEVSRQGRTLTEPPAQPDVPSADAQAACTYRKRSRWDVMPESMSADGTVGHHTAACSLSAAQFETVVTSGPEPSHAERPLQPLHSQQATDQPCDVFADSRQEQTEAETHQDSHDACRRTPRAQQHKKGSRTVSKHSRHRGCCDHSSHHGQRSHRHSRHWRRSRPEAVDCQCIMHGSQDDRWQLWRPQDV